MLFFSSDVADSTGCIPEDEVVSNVSGHWLRFNDVLVDEFSLNDVAIEAECFGGTYKAKANEGGREGEYGGREEGVGEGGREEGREMTWPLR